MSCLDNEVGFEVPSILFRLISRTGSDRNEKQTLDENKLAFTWFYVRLVMCCSLKM
jgi:hypothetical protein